MTKLEPPDRKRRIPWRRISTRLLRLLVIGYVTITLALVVMESRLVYPGAFLSHSPALPHDNLSHHIETIAITTAPGETLPARLLQHDRARHQP